MTHYSDTLDKTAIIRGKKIEICNVLYLEVNKRSSCVAERLKALLHGA